MSPSPYNTGKSSEWQLSRLATIAYGWGSMRPAMTRAGPGTVKSGASATRLAAFPIKTQRGLTRFSDPPILARDQSSFVSGLSNEE